SAFQVLAVRVAQLCKGSRPKVRRVVDEYVQPSEFAHDLHGDGMDVGLYGNVAHDSVCADVSPGHLLHAARRTGHKRHARTTAEQFTDESQTQPRGATRDGDPKAGERIR